MSLLKAIKAQLGLSNTPANNFLFDASADNGTMKLQRGNGQDILTVDANGVVASVQGIRGGLFSGTAQNTTSGTSIDFTGIPSWAKRITVMFNGVSTNGSSSLLVQIGAGSITSSGYSGVGGRYNFSSATNGVSSTAGFPIGAYSTSTDFISGCMFICLVSGNNWISSHSVKANTTFVGQGGGDVALSGTLDRIRITTVNGTDTFDAGSVNILYEG